MLINMHSYHMSRLYSTLFALLVLLMPASLFAQQELLNNATVAYDSAQYQQVIDIYQQVADQYGVSADLYYNIGNAYFKLKDYPHAILNYERCLLHDPANADALQNVELARAQCVDRVETITPPIFVTWSRALRDVLSCSAWGHLGIVTFLLFLVGGGVYFFSSNTTLRKTGFYSGLLCLLLFLISINYAGQQRDKLLERDQAIVLVPSVVVRSSPADSGTQLFTIHEGLKVRVRSTLSGWSEIELSDGKVGWIPSDGLEVI